MEDYALGRNVTKLPPGLAHFDWDTKLQDILPRELPPIFASSWARSQATFRDVLSHMSGIGRRVTIPNRSTYTDRISPRSQDFVYGDDESPISLLQHLQHLRPVYELRERFSYANFVCSLLALPGLRVHNTYSSTRFVLTLSPSTLEWRTRTSSHSGSSYRSGRPLPPTRTLRPWLPEDSAKAGPRRAEGSRCGWEIGRQLHGQVLLAYYLMP